MWGAVDNIACYGPVLTERANVVIELFIKLIINYAMVLSGTPKH